MSTPARAGNVPQHPVRLGVVGCDRHARDLAAQHPWEYPFVGRHAVITACAPLASANRELEALARRTGARLMGSWRELLAASDVDAVLLLVPPPRRPELVRAAIEAGCAVLCPAPLAPDAHQLRALAQAIADAQAVVVTAGVLAHTPAGRNALEVLASGTVGRIESAFAAVRWHAHDAHAGSAHAGLPDAAWDVLDFVLEALDAPVSRVYAHAARLFESGNPHDTVVSIMRFASGTVFSFEAAACLPPVLTIPDAGEIELELIGAHEALRIEPFQTAVSVALTSAQEGVPLTSTPAGVALTSAQEGVPLTSAQEGVPLTSAPGEVPMPGAQARIERRDWIDPPIAGMLGALLAAMHEPSRAHDGIARQQRLCALADAMRASIDSAQPVEVIAA